MSRKVYLFIIVICFALNPSFSQEENFGVVFWSKERNLTWEDIGGHQLIDTSSTFYLDLYINNFGMSNRRYQISDPYENLAYIFNNTSYVSEEIRTDELLRYLNIYFDMAAYYSFKYIDNSRRAAKSDSPEIRNNASVIANAVIEEWKLESTRLSMETDYGNTMEALDAWEIKVNKLVDKIIIPEPKMANYGVGMELGFGKLVGLSDYDDLLTEPFVGILGGEFEMKSYVFGIGIAGGGQRVKQSFSKGIEDFQTNSEPNLMNIFFHGGYELFDTKRFKFIPRVGIHFSNLRYPMNVRFTSSIWQFSYTTGATFDIKLFGRDSRNPYSFIHQDLTLRLGSYYYPMKAGDNNISHMHFTLGLCWFVSESIKRY